MSIELLHMDCMEYMEAQPDNAFDLAIVDPPYGIRVKTNMGRRAGVPNHNPPATWDSSPPDNFYFSELARVSKNQVIWGANHFLSAMWLDFDVNTPCWLLWDKGFSEDLSFAQFEMAWTSFTGVCKKFDRSSADPKRIHPTQKPVALYEWQLRRYAKPGQRILDTHLGSGSSAIAAHYFGVDFVGTELDADYYQAAKARFERETAQIDIFQEVAP